MLRKIFSGIALTMLLTSVFMSEFNISPASTSQQTDLQLKTDKSTYKLGETVTITLKNIGDNPQQFEYDIPWVILTYPDERNVYPGSHIRKDWKLEPGGEHQWLWSQYNAFELKPAELGNYVIKDTEGWGLFWRFSIVTTRIVSPGDSIQEVIDNSSDGDEIFVRAGTYFECITINKPLSIVGEGRENTSISGLGVPKSPVVHILSSNVTLHDLNITEPNKTPWYAIVIGSERHSRLRYINISGNTIYNCEVGIFIWNASDINIENNDLDNNWMNGIYSGLTSERIRVFNNTMHQEGTPEKDSACIRMTGSQGSIISRNNITNIDLGIMTSESVTSTYVGNELHDCNRGIRIVNGRDNLISDNRMYKNDLCISLLRGSNNTVVENEIFENPQGTGIEINYSGNNTVIHNTVKNTETGIHIISSTHNNVTDNFLYNCSQAFTLGASQNNPIRGNVIQACGCAVSTDDGSTNNTICGNDFLENDICGNECPIYVSEQGTNCWDNNYWSDYEGVDTDDDGCGDTSTPHHDLDYSPSIIPRSPIPIYWKQKKYECIIAGSMTVSGFQLDPDKKISFNVTGQGYVNVTISKNLLDGSFKVHVNDIQIPHSVLWDSTSKLPFPSWSTSICFNHSASSPNNVKIEAERQKIGDLNGDGKIDILDAAIVGQNFGWPWVEN